MRTAWRCSTRRPPSSIPFTVEDFTSFQSDQKAAMEEKALSRGLLAEARAKAVSSVEQLFAAALPDTYTVTVQ